MKKDEGINVLSLFDGISCGQLAFKRLGIKINKYYASEIDKYAIAITKYNFSDTIFVGDIRNLKSKDFKNIDIIIGGSPCQNFSFVGKRQGMITKEKIEIITLSKYLELKEQGFEFEGQSYLFWEFVRLLNEIKPKYFLLENTKMPKKWQNIISNALGVEPIEINSALVSAQNRKRLYWVGVLKNGKYRQIKISSPKDMNILLQDILEDKTFRQIPDCLFGYYGNRKRIDACNWTKKNKSNTITTRSTHTSQYLLNDNKTKCRIFTINEVEQLQTLPYNYTKYGIFDNEEIKKISNTQRYKCIGNGWTIDIIVHIFKQIFGV